MPFGVFQEPFINISLSRIFSKKSCNIIQNFPPNLNDRPDGLNGNQPIKSPALIMIRVSSESSLFWSAREKLNQVLRDT